MTTLPPGLLEDAGTATDVGCRREVNEDSVVFVIPHDAALLREKGVLAVVADGMGGHAAGEVASRLAVETIRRAYYELPLEPGEALADAFQLANRLIWDASRQEGRLEGMGTTCTALAVRGSQAFSAHVGDSRLYMIRGDAIYTMTEDHSAVRDLVNRGVISAADARHHADRNVILRALGTREEVAVATWHEALPVRASDRFLLCSDGLHDLVEAEELLAAVRDFGPREACEQLVQLARERGGYDNITAAVVGIETEAQAQDRNRAADTRDCRVGP
jgi:protein phosphatase